MSTEALDRQKLIELYLTTLGVPETEWEVQFKKFSQYDRTELEKEIYAVKELIALTEKDLEASETTWKSEEFSRNSLINGKFPTVRDWLVNSLRKVVVYSDLNAFSPFQDLVSPETVSDDMYRLYLSIPRERRKVWSNAIAEVTARSILRSFDHQITPDFLELMSKIDGLSTLAADSNISIELLQAHSRGYVKCEKILLLKIYETACMTMHESWMILTRWVNRAFLEALEDGDLSEKDFRNTREVLFSKLPIDVISHQTDRITENRWIHATFKSYRFYAREYSDIARPKLGITTSIGNISNKFDGMIESLSEAENFGETS